MSASREHPNVTWWRMGKLATEKWGFEHARAVAQEIHDRYIRHQFMRGATGSPKPAVRKPVRKETT